MFHFVTMKKLLWSHLWSHKKSHRQFILCKWLILWLSGQESNLDSSDPESDVLPVTPPDKIECKSRNSFCTDKNIIDYLQEKNESLRKFWIFLKIRIALFEKSFLAFLRFFGKIIQKSGISCQFLYSGLAV
jgi:hypothetical protein